MGVTHHLIGVLAEEVSQKWEREEGCREEKNESHRKYPLTGGLKEWKRGSVKQFQNTNKAFEREGQKTTKHTSHAGGVRGNDTKISKITPTLKSSQYTTMTCSNESGTIYWSPTTKDMVAAGEVGKGVQHPLIVILDREPMDGTTTGKNKQDTAPGRKAKL